MGKMDCCEATEESFKNINIDVDENEAICDEEDVNCLEGSNNWNKLTTKEQNKYVQLAQSGDKEAVAFILQGLSFFVYKKASYYAHQNHLEKMDLYQEGMIGILNAIQKYNPDKNVKFITFAVYYIKSSIFSYLHNNANIIRIPTHLLEKYFKIKQNLHYNYDISERDLLLQIENISEFNYYKIWSIRNMKSLDSSYNYDGHNNYEKEEYALLDTITSLNESDVLSRMIKKDREILIDKLLNSLSEKARVVIMMRFGIGYDKEYTLEEIGKVMSVTRERVRQIESKTLRQFRSILYRNNVLNMNDY